MRQRNFRYDCRDCHYRPRQSRDCKGAVPITDRDMPLKRANRPPSVCSVISGIRMPGPLLCSHGSVIGGTWVISWQMKFQLSPATSSCWSSSRQKRQRPSWRGHPCPWSWRLHTHGLEGRASAPAKAFDQKGGSPFQANVTGLKSTAVTAFP